MPAEHGRDRVSPGRDGAWSVESPESKGWQARRPATRTSAEHPGTAIDWDGEIYEVTKVEPRGAGARYTLVRWEDRHTIRRLERYDDESETRRSGERADAARRMGIRRRLLLLAPLGGHLPASVQEGWEREYDVSAARVTAISAFPLFVYGILCTLSLTIQGFTGQAILPFSLKALFFGMFLMVESGFRLSAAWGEGRPAGSLEGHLIWELTERGRGLVRRDAGR